jgi:hypothetical protein
MIDTTAGIVGLPLYFLGQYFSLKAKSKLIIDDRSITAGVVQMRVHSSGQCSSVKTLALLVVDDKCHRSHRSYTIGFVTQISFTVNASPSGN